MHPGMGGPEGARLSPAPSCSATASARQMWGKLNKEKGGLFMAYRGTVCQAQAVPPAAATRDHRAAAQPQASCEPAAFCQYTMGPRSMRRMGSNTCEHVAALDGCPGWMRCCCWFPLPPSVRPCIWHMRQPPVKCASLMTLSLGPAELTTCTMQPSPMQQLSPMRFHGRS